MALEIFKLVGSIFVDSAEADKSLAKTDKNAQSVGKTLAQGIGTAAKWGTAIVGGATAAATGIVALANDTASAADEIDKASIRMGVSTDYYQQLAYAAEQSGVEIASLEKAAKSLEGTDINLEEAMDQIMALTTAEERASLAADLFGEAQAYKLSPLIEQSAESFDGLIDRANELGLVMSKDQVDAGVKLGDTMNDVKKAFGAFVKQIGSSVLPIVQKFLDVILGNLPAIQGMIDQLIPIVAALADALLPPLLELVQQIFPVLAELFNALLPVVSEIVGALLPIIVELLQTLLPPLLEIVQAILPVAVDILHALMPLIELAMELLMPVLDLVLALIPPMVKFIAQLLPPLISALVELFRYILEPAIGIIKKVAEALTQYFVLAFEKMEPVIDSVKKAFQGVLDFITGVFEGDWEKAWNGIVGIFTNLWEGMKTGTKATLNEVIKIINKAFAALGKISIPDWVPVIGGKEFSLPQIPMLAEGGTINRAGSAIVGEAGAELIDLPTGARVTPLNGTVDLIDYDKLAVAIVKAIRTVAPELRSSVTVNADTDRLFDVFIDKASERSFAGMEVY